MQTLVFPGLAPVSGVNDGGFRTDRPDLIGILAAAHREEVFAHGLGRVDLIPGLAAIGRAQDERLLAANDTVVGIGAANREEREMSPALLQLHLGGAVSDAHERAVAP